MAVVQPPRLTGDALHRLRPMSKICGQIFHVLLHLKVLVLGEGAGRLHAAVVLGPAVELAAGGFEAPVLVAGAAPLDHACGGR